MEIEVWCSRRILLMAMENLKSYVCTNGVSGDDDKVIWLANCSGSITRRVRPAEGRQVSEDGFNLNLKVIWWAVASEWSVAVITETSKIAPMDVDMALGESGP
ncbi:hypothetical protein BJF96_g10171 [Verticillium dahliae]|uniref:Uncharacterized protein n=1 Tax=Verticillium dahliae TaxID=27337 RepID=A0AA45AHD1_VERDA|nr:hypothetical protein BJF96_g10171 [Verticillium dahliae]